MGVLFEVKLVNLVQAQLIEVFVQFDSNGVGVKLLRGHNHDAAVAGTQIVHLLAGLETA